MAYLQPLAKQCRSANCPTAATQRLMSNRNEEFGVYCTRHASQQLKALLTEERTRAAGMTR